MTESVSDVAIVTISSTGRAAASADRHVDSKANLASAQDFGTAFASSSGSNWWSPPNTTINITGDHS